MISRRRAALALGLLPLAGALALVAQAQPAPGVHRIGFLAARSRSTSSNPDVYYDAFVQGMRELGYVEGHNLVIEWRFADGKFERLPALAADLVRLKVEVIATHASPTTKALQRATGTIPIVVAATSDPVGSGFAATLARPGGNITGLSLMDIDVNPKRLEFLKLVTPALSRVAVLENPGTPNRQALLTSVEAAASQVGVKVFPVNAETREGIERGFAEMRRERADAVMVTGDAFFVGQEQRRQIAELASRHRLPSMFWFREDVEAGGLMSYGQNLTDFYRRAATYVDRILKGAKPSDMPMEQPTRLHLAINLKTAKALGLTIPQSLLLRADEVIE